ncbi:MAG: flagellar motor switch protein FliG [Fimbriimonadaceae bacterium]|nr:flagellar motor switch protein FliG [Fimbriimonadaceae bacterium]QYK59190.1 MAG: flagellar motor switch protein FliG [Fimbriimonadaceae bacterium]
MRKVQSELTSRRKAAIILAVLGTDLASEVLKHLTEDQVETLTLEIARLDKVSPDVRGQVVQEFHEIAQAQDFIAEGGVENAKRALEKAFGAEQADVLIRKVVNAMQIVPFEFLKRTDPQQLLSFIQDEHPQTIALILAFMPLNQSAMILTKLPPELRADVAERIAVMENTPPEVVRKVEQVLEKKMSSVISQEMSKAGGPKALVDLLNRVDRQTERLILDSLTENNPEMADNVKNMMFVFEDIVQLDDRAVQSVLKEVDARELAVALKGVPAEVQEKVFKNMSERAVNMLKEDMEFMGPVKLRAVEEAQQKVVASIRRLEETGEISIGRGEEDVLV